MQLCCNLNCRLKLKKWTWNNSENCFLFLAYHHWSSAFFLLTSENSAFFLASDLLSHWSKWEFYHWLKRQHKRVQCSAYGRGSSSPYNTGFLKKLTFSGTKYKFCWFFFPLGKLKWNILFWVSLILSCVWLSFHSASWESKCGRVKEILSVSPRAL